MKTVQIVKELEAAVEQLGLRVRREKGNFRGGYCVRNEEEFLMLNRVHPPEVHLAVLADALKTMDVDSVYLRPLVRQALEDAWARNDVIDIKAEDGD
ncbi:MAG: hypothetical protein HOC28_10655 [Bacteroidetes Order II. Incertae sedis bacterium]|jgi:hypothetical protein|nr:hypothetical protein [Bacteroidetes Order II. bacterium]MDG1754496.1 hypothetical protein [Rhodothermales bacterium]HAY36817.1 hypothetical protein [Bacteroidota bacterium]MBT4052262.1 hypothetical protein [Bacteroidetes Order II. bacterium]MBT4603585.1 hypothetical protein [Bacteroidetes Order II. bacterium]